MAKIREKRRSLGAALAVAGLLTACTPREAPPEPQPQPAPAPPPAAPAPLPTPPALNRVELLRLVAQAASAAAAGAPASPEAEELEGRRFDLRLPFGCFGPTADDSPTGYAYDAERGVLRVSARPTSWSEAAWARELLGAPEAEALEGFWIDRPWLLTETCPARPPLGNPEPQTVGLVQVFEAGGSRVLRRGRRAYEAVRKAEPAQAVPTGGLRLVLQGRLEGAEGRAPIRCLSEAADRRPVCLVRVQLERVALATAQDETLAEWTE